MHLFLIDTFVKHKVPPPAVLAYDDGCHLLKFEMNRADRSAFAKCACTPLAPLSCRAHLASHGRSRPSVPRIFTRQLRRWLITSVKIVVDRFHWRNHKNNPFCRDNVDPSKCPALGPRTNTEAAESVSPRNSPAPHTLRDNKSAPRCTPPPRSTRLACSPLTQSFAWLARSKHIFRHMNEARFLFTMLRLMELRNRWLVAHPAAV